MLHFLRKFKPSPCPVSSDTVVPVGVFDDTLLHHNAVICTTFLYENVLDADRLATSLWHLVEQVGWQKLGARLRQSSTGALEHHIPSAFTEARPAITFAHIELPMVRANHPVGSLLPNATTKPSVMIDPNEVQALWSGHGIPTKLSHYLSSDIPQLGLIVVSFDDATVVSLNWPHTLFDAVGLGEVVHAWSMILQDKLDEVVRPHAFDRDPLAELGTQPSEPHIYESNRLSRAGHATYALRLASELIFQKQESRMIYVTADFIQKLHHDAVQDLRSTTTSETEPFLTEGDVLSAWWVKVNSAHLSEEPDQLVQLVNALGWRPSLAGDMLPPDKPYISNAVGLASVFISSDEIFTKPLGHIAAQIRQSIINCRTKQQIEAYAALWRSSIMKMPPMFGESNMHMLLCSNWSKAGLFDADFSAAIKLGCGDPSRTPLQPSYIQSCFHGVLLFNVLAILGKDIDGGYWLTGFTNGKHWPSILQAINSN